MFQIISGTSKTVSGTQNLERNVANTAHKNVSDISLLLGTLFLLVFPVTANPFIIRLQQQVGRRLPATVEDVAKERAFSFPLRRKLNQYNAGDK